VLVTTLCHGVSLSRSVPGYLKTKSTKKNHVMGSNISNALCRTPQRLVIVLCVILTFFGCTRTVEKFCAVDQETLKQNLIRLVESPVIKDDDWVNAASITVDSVESFPPSDRKTQVSFVVHWTSGVGDARADHSGTWQANFEKAADKHCHVTGVAIRSGDIWIKAINTDFEIK
jgi:hypothetical protein